MADRPVNYEQNDPRWAKYLYDINPADGDDYLSGSGCGPTCAAMVVATYCDPKITPVEMADWSVAHGYRTKTNGTAWGLFAGVAKEYGLTFLQTYGNSAALSCIQDGGIVVCIMGPGLWTSGGHFILWYAYDGSYVYINDPASTAAKREKAKLSLLQAQRRCYFCFWPPEKQESEDEDDMVRYEKLKDIPNDWGARDVVEVLMDAGIIGGDGSDPDGNGDVIDLSHDQVRSLIFAYRGGAFDRRLIAEGLDPAVGK